MKSLKISLLALPILVGGMMVANAAKTDVGQTLNVDVTFNTNARPSFIEVSDTLPVLPPSVSTNARVEVYLDTDGAGKIEGAGWVRIEYKTTVITVVSNVPTATNYLTTSYSDYITDITGKLGTKGTAPSAQLSVKGQGYSSSAPTNFAGGFTQYAPAAGESKLNLKFTSTGTAVVLNTNDNRYYVTGTYKGSIAPGIDAINNGKTMKVDSTAALRVRYEVVENLDLALVSFGSKFSAIAGEGSFVGSGNVSSGNNNYNMNLKGIGSNRGSNLKLTGTVGNQNVIIVGQTNVVISLSSVTLDGKVLGQKIAGTGTAVAR